MDQRQRRLNKKSIIFSQQDFFKARARLKKQRTERLPKREDLAMLESKANEDMRESNRRLGLDGVG